MKTRPPPAGKTYRNEAVYRSAEKLLSLPVRRPSERRGLRQLLIVTFALTLGVVIGFHARRSPSPTPETPSPAKNDSAQSLAPVSPSSTISARPPALAPASDLSRETTVQHTPEPESIDSRVTPQNAIAPHRSNGASVAIPRAHTTASIVSTSELYLYGELRAPAHPPETVILTLRRSSDQSTDPLTGVIRFLKENRPFAGNALAGAQNGLTLTLRETGPVWVNGDIDIHPVGRRFVIAIPLDTTTAEFTGTWSLGDTQGTLHLKAATVR